MAKPKITYFTRDEVRMAIEHKLAILEAQHRRAYPNTFSEMTYPLRKAKYLSALQQLNNGQVLSNRFLAKLLGKGARLYDYRNTQN